jgi:hypothetical protein
MESLGWRRRWGSSPAARRGARQRAGLTPVSASNTLSCKRETLHPTNQKSLDSDHGIYRDWLLMPSRAWRAAMAAVPE